MNKRDINILFKKQTKKNNILAYKHQIILNLCKSC